MVQSMDANKNQTSIAYTSVMTTFALLLAIISISVHYYQYTNLFTTIKTTQLFKKIHSIVKAANGEIQQTKMVDTSNSNVSESESTQNNHQEELPTLSLKSIILKFTLRH